MHHLYTLHSGKDHYKATTMTPSAMRWVLDASLVTSSPARFPSGMKPLQLGLPVILRQQTAAKA